MIDCTTQSCITCPENESCDAYQYCVREERCEKVFYALLGLAIEMDNDTMIDIIVDTLNKYDLDEQYNKYVQEGIKFKMEYI